MPSLDDTLVLGCNGPYAAMVLTILIFNVQNDPVEKIGSAPLLLSLKKKENTKNYAEKTKYF